MFFFLKCPAFWKRVVPWWLKRGALAFVLYVLSIGPVAALTAKYNGYVYWDAIEFFYMPVTWLHNYTPLEEPLEWYVALWFSLFSVSTG